MPTSLCGPLTLAVFFALSIEGPVFSQMSTLMAGPLGNLRGGSMEEQACEHTFLAHTKDGG